jgi:hypothetical protein
VGSRTVLDAVVKRKIPSPLRESNPRTSIVQPVGTSTNRKEFGYEIRGKIESRNFLRFSRL